MLLRTLCFISPPYNNRVLGSKFLWHKLTNREVKFSRFGNKIASFIQAGKPVQVVRGVNGGVQT